MFSHSVGCSFILFMVFFAVQKLAAILNIKFSVDYISGHSQRRILSCLGLCLFGASNVRILGETCDRMVEKNNMERVGG